MLGQLKRTSTSLNQLASDLPNHSLSGWRFYSLVFIASFIIVVSRRPDSLFNAQFYAEDGVIWFAQAYNTSAIQALFIPYAGYLHLFPRLFAGLAVGLDLDILYVPLFLNIVAICIKILPVLFFLSSRFPFSRAIKLYVSLLYLGLPGAWEVHANISNAYLHLALLAFMVLIAQPARTRKWQIFDIAILVLSALTGPFCIFLLPVAAYCYYKRRTLLNFSYLIILLVCSGIQAVYIKLTSTPNDVPIQALVPYPEQFFRTLLNQIWFNGILGARITTQLLTTTPAVVWSWIAFIAGVAGVGVTLYLLKKGPSYLRLFIYFTGILLLVSMVSSIVRMGANWDIMSTPLAGGRYYFLPCIAYVVSLVYLAGKSELNFLKFGSAFLLVLMLLGIFTDWTIPPLQNENFQAQVIEFRTLPSGMTYNFRIPPQGWSFDLVKR
jgi:hypothetical protein